MSKNISPEIKIKAVRYLEEGLYKTQYEEALKTFGTRNSYSKNNPDAIFMRMKDDYMKNRKLKPGYNLQIANRRTIRTRLTIIFKPNRCGGRSFPFWMKSKNIIVSCLNILSQMQVMAAAKIMKTS